MRARFHLPDFSLHFKFNIIFAELLKHRPEYFREGVEIASVYGSFPPALWTGGRTQGGICTKQFMKAVIRSFNERGIPLRFTFTNPLIEKKHLNDNFCNTILHLADNGLNEVIVLSPLLEEYIRKNYPSYKITSSTCKRITDPDQLISETEKDYHIVVIDYDLNHDFETLRRIPDKKKCELLVNAGCIEHCPMRSAHYRAIGLQQIAFAEHMKKNPNTPFDSDKLVREHPELQKFADCPYAQRNLFDVIGLPNYISPDEIWNTYIPMGFEQFKIEGRTAELFNLTEHYMHYMAKPEYKERARYEFLWLLENNDVIQINE
ncbi:MAG: hypothetical protein J6Z45_00290 [Oscillospiraceae bacterium]|nr:hypothetical protein [Oscillospiraceae bacterium]